MLEINGTNLTKEEEKECATYQAKVYFVDKIHSLQNRTKLSEREVHRIIKEVSNTWGISRLDALRTIINWAIDRKLSIIKVDPTKANSLDIYLNKVDNIGELLKNEKPINFKF